MDPGIETSGRNRSLWLSAANDDGRRFAPLPDDLMADVCVIGAGLAGLTTAYLLSREGQVVVVLEDGLIGSGETGRTTAHLSNAVDDRYVEIERLHGREHARLVADSHTAAIARIEQIVREEKIPCDFCRVDGYLLLSPDHGVALLEQEREAAHRAGLTAVELLESSPLGSVNGPCLRFPNQGQFHPMKYLTGLAQAVVRQGGRIYTETHVTELRKGKPVEVLTKAGRTVRADAVVVATNTPVTEWVVMHTKQAPYRTYAIAAEIPPGTVPPALYWDTEDPYHYVRVQPEDRCDVLIVGGEDHKTGQGADAHRYDRLSEWARRWFPQMGWVRERWSGQIMESVDGLGYIGRSPGESSEVYLATGDSGMGMTHGTIAGMLLTDLILKRGNPWAPVYDPGRVRARAMSEVASENVNVLAQYADWVTPAEVKSADEIPAGQGGILRMGLKKLAVYRDRDGQVHQRSAVCPHLRCIVSWNSVEQTWDCPCHGSRFDPYGKVLNGPANSDLSEES